MSMIHFNKQCLKQALDYRGLKLEDLSELVDRDTRTLWRYWQKEEIPSQVLDVIAKELDVSFNYLTGSEHDFYKPLLDDDSLRDRFEKELAPEKYPYIRNYEHTSNFDNYDEYIEVLLARHHVSMPMYANMTAHDRLHMLKDLEEAIKTVLSSYFEVDALGLASDERMQFGLYSILNDINIAAYEQFDLDLTGYSETDEAEFERKYQAYSEACDKGSFDI